MKIFIIFYLLCASSLSAFFDYDQAVNAAQNNNWESANRLLTELVVNKPDDPSVLYDAGIAAFNIKNFSQAQIYFEHAAQSQKAPGELKEQAYFNAGNTQVELKQLEQAIASYEKVLEINPNNERAKHNLEIVKKMLEQQKQQQEKKQDNNKQQQDKNQQKQDQQQEKSEQDQSGSDQGNENEQQQEGSDQQGDQGQQKQDNNTNGRQSKQNKGQQEQSQKQNGQQDQAQQEKGAQQQTANNEQSQGEKEEKEKSTASGKEKKQEKQELKTTKNGDKSENTRDAWLAQVLQENEQEDAQLNKQMMKAMVGNQLAGRDGQNCW